MCAFVQNKNISNCLNKATHTKVFFFVVLLISFSLNQLSAQTSLADTITTSNADTLKGLQTSDDFEKQVTYHAEDSTVTLVAEGKVLFYGKAKVVYEGVEMQADVIEIDYKNNLMLAYGRTDSSGKQVGNPVFKEGNQPPMEAEKIMYNIKSGRGKIFNALTRQGELLLNGKEIKKDSNDIVYMKNMRCIPCQEADARTVFVAGKAKIIPDDKIVTGPMYLEVGGVPTPLGLPFGYFPNSKRQHNGLLLPTFNTSAQFGYYLQNGGFYWGISDVTDMVIRGDIYANGSFGINTTNSYKMLYKATGRVYLSYYRYNFGDRDVKSRYYSTQTYEVKWQHTQDNRKNPSVNFNADVNYISNQRINRLNAANTEQFLQSQFISSVNYSKRFKASSLAMSARQEQNTQTGAMSLVLPTITYYVNTFNPFKNPTHVRQNVIDKINVSYRVEASNRLKGVDTTIFKSSWIDSLQYGLSQTLPISTNFNLFKYITVQPQIDLNSIVSGRTVSKTLEPFYRSDTLAGYAIKNQINNKPAVGYDARFSTSFNTKLYFDYLFKKGKIKQIRHLMIPSVAYNYRPDFGEEQYGFWKQVQTDTLGNRSYYSIFERSVYGGPGRGAVNAVSFRINNSIDAKQKLITDTGATFVKTKVIEDFQLAGSYNFAADSFRMSNISLTARTTLFKNLSVNYGSELDPYAWNHATGRRSSSFAYDKGQGAARMVYSFLALTSSIGSNMIEARKRAKEKPQMASGAERGMDNDLDNNGKLPWNLNVSYRLELSNYNDYKLMPAQTFQLSGDVMPTKYWKLGISTGYNFSTMSVSRTQFTLSRDLKCWVANIEWVPFGLGKRYSVGITLKSSMFSDLKIPRQRPWVDNVR